MPPSITKRQDSTRRQTTCENKGPPLGDTVLSETNQTQKIHIAQFHSEEAPRVVKQGGVKAEWIQDPPPPTHLLPTPRKNSEVNV